mmetsp:Transcript_23938/g.28249  ORF Transcript_23938/g.28249 Transcript_23938/m.28249 type:complete len:138 (-) Transcript_23938:487-900(-)
MNFINQLILLQAFNGILLPFLNIHLSLSENGVKWFPLILFPTKINTDTRLHTNNIPILIPLKQPPMLLPSPKLLLLRQLLNPQQSSNIPRRLPLQRHTHHQTHQTKQRLHIHIIRRRNELIHHLPLKPRCKFSVPGG